MVFYLSMNILLIFLLGSSANPHFNLYLMPKSEIPFGSSFSSFFTTFFKEDNSQGLACYLYPDFSTQDHFQLKDKDCTEYCEILMTDTSENPLQVQYHGGQVYNQMYNSGDSSYPTLYWNISLDSSIHWSWWGYYYHLKLYDPYVKQGSEYVKLETFWTVEPQGPSDQILYMTDQYGYSNDFLQFYNIYKS